MEAECELVGESMPDIAGVGIIVGFVGQALLSLLLAGWVFLLSKHGSLDLRHQEGTVEHRIERKRLQAVSDILMVGNDIQMVLGISYMINAFAYGNRLDLYHLHLVFDIVSFVGVSNAAAMVFWTFCAFRLDGMGTKLGKPKPLKSYLTSRHRASYLFAAMFLALTILLCVRLDEWAPDQEPGMCYHARLVTADGGAGHPTADKTYVAITAVWTLLAMAGAIFLNAHRRRYVLVSAVLQFPVHLYMALALRAANQGRLEGEGGDENGWDFGQTTAVVLLGGAISELFAKAREYFAFERDLVRNGLPPVEDDDGGVGVLKARSRSRDADDHRRLGLNLLKLCVLELLAARKAHLEVLDRPDLLLQTPNLLGVGVLRRVGALGLALACWRRRRSALGNVVTVATRALLRVAAAAIAVVPRPAADVAAVAVSKATPLRAAALASGAGNALVRRRGQACAAVGFSLGLALLVALFASLLLIPLGGTVAVDGLGARNTPPLCGFDRLRAGHGSAGPAAEAIGPDVLRSVAHDVGSAALVLALEMQRSGKTAGARGSIRAGGLARRLNRAETTLYNSTISSLYMTLPPTCHSFTPLSTRRRGDVVAVMM
ncbi:Autophagy-like protein 18 [Purpureocillium lavendulum]|uniref:Autophagy-like protein 18 n=1 Tax=Purpureocillium lavendulum TaxID=1247861 RepID=A0AB34FPQ3_9HYPO|nr:Autophagy-like protein 18 [Purpureocillium lavendulum]